jgi:hypothetical protein
LRSRKASDGIERCSGDAVSVAFDNNMNHKLQRLGAVAAFGLVLISSWLTIALGTPSLLSPFNIPVFLAALISGSSLLASLLMPAIFLAWSWPVLTRSAVLPIRSVIFFALCLGLSCLWHIVGIDYGIRYQGRDFVVGVSTINAIFCSMMVALAMIGRRHPQYWLNLSFHMLFFTWLGYSAFPYFGELM